MAVPSQDRKPLAPPAVPLGAQVDAIADELRRAFTAFEKVGPAVTVFGSARTPPDDPGYELARRAGYELGSAGYAVITGGGPGVMAAANHGAREAGAVSVGVNIELPGEFPSYGEQDLSLNVRHFFVRKVLLVRFSRGFVYCPGGVGTLDELFEVLALIDVAMLERFPLVLLGAGEWRGLLEWLRERPLAAGRISASTLELLRTVDDPAELPAIIGPPPADG